MYKNYTKFWCTPSGYTYKLFLIMKLTAIILITALMQVSAATFGQKLTLIGNNIPIEKVFVEISNQTGYDVLISTTKFKATKKINANFRGIDLKEVMQTLVEGTDLTFTIEDKTVVIKEKAPSFLDKVTAAFADITIKGSVVDKKGEPLVGVNVIVKGTKQIVETDGKGKFSLKVADNSNVTLVFRLIGFISKEVTLTDKKKDLAVVLEEDLQQLNDVVVVGYGTVKKRDLTTSISSITAEDIMKTPVTSLEQALQGNAAGVLVTNTSGEPGGEISIRVRGGSSIKADNEPLLVIDGFTTDQGLGSLNPSDIKSIEVLKDAGATAIYGSRGANGVILVTTKNGDAGKPRVAFQSYFGFQQLRRKLPLLNASQLAELANEANEAVGKSPNTLRPDTVPTTIDWQNQMFQVAPQLSNTINVTGGDNNVKYYVSGNYLDQKGLITNSNFSRISLRSNLDFSFNKWIKAGIKLNLSQTIKKGIQVGDNGSILRANATNPNLKGLLDPSGSFYIDPETGDPTSTSPLANAQETINKRKEGNIQVGGFVVFNILKNLSLRSGGTYNPSNRLYDYYFPNTIKGDKVSDAYEQFAQSDKWSNDNTLTYSAKLNKHSFTLLAGEEITNSFSHDFKARNTDFNTDVFTYYNLGSGNGVPSVTSSAAEYKLLSFFGRATYNFNDRYLATATYRADGSSKFGNNNKWGYFPSFSFAWRASNESFIKSLNLFSDLKARLTYGVNGSDRISAYSSQALYSTQFSAIGGSQKTGYKINKLANPDLKWEKTKEYDAGLDMAFFKGRIAITADYYHKITNDLLLDFGLPGASGYTTVAKNIGSVENKGVEFDITTRNLTGKFTWTTSFNAAYNKNLVTDLGGPKQISSISNSSANTKFGNVVLIKVGEPLGVFWGYRSNGIFQTQAEIDATPMAAKLEGSKTLPGFPKFLDIDGNGVLNDDDKVILGNPQPKWNGGFTNNFTYKNFDLTVFMVYQYGNSILNTSYTKLMDLTGSNNQLTKALDRWKAPNPETGYAGNPSNTIPRAYATGYSAAMSDYYIEDGSYLRVKTITFGYTLPKKTMQRIGLSSLRIYASGTNLITFTNYYGGYDPEVSIMGKNGVGAGMDNGSYPTSKLFLFGLNLNF